MFANQTDEGPVEKNPLSETIAHKPLLSEQVFHMVRSDALALCDLASYGTPETDVVEIPILLPGWQASALEDAANLRGLTAGEMLRHLLADVLPRPQERNRQFDAHKDESADAWG